MLDVFSHTVTRLKLLWQEVHFKPQNSFCEWTMGWQVGNSTCTWMTASGQHFIYFWVVLICFCGVLLLFFGERYFYLLFLFISSFFLILFFLSHFLFYFLPVIAEKLTFWVYWCLSFTEEEILVENNSFCNTISIFFFSLTKCNMICLELMCDLRAASQISENAQKVLKNVREKQIEAQQ